MIGSSLPALDPLSDATIYSRAVEPFLYQFYEVERFLYGEISLWTYFKETNPFVLGLHLCLLWTVFTMTASILTENWSWTDRFWSITPTSYVTLLVVWSEIHGIRCPRLLLFWSLHLLWSARLTHNYHRKGGYARGSEDYRWRVLSDKMGTFAFVVLQLVYIPAQNLLVAAITVPAYIVLLIGDRRPLGPVDAVSCLVTLFALVGQAVSDDRQRDYQEAKRRTSAKPGHESRYSRAQLDRGFLTAGPFSVSRHPAFVCEQVVWVTFCLWSLTVAEAWQTAAGWRSYGALGCAAYVALFQGSTRLTEQISRSRYPAYGRYQAVVGMLLPLPFCRWHEASEVVRAHQHAQK